MSQTTKELIDVSIILPSYNVEKYIEECLQSVCNNDNIEIICIDAGSTDKTLDLIEMYENKDSRIKIVNSQKKSYGYQVNVGIKLARGKYIQIVETDDYIIPGALRDLVNLAEKYNLDYIKGDYYGFVDVESERIFKEYKMPEFINDSQICNIVITPSKHCEVYLRDTSIWRGIYRKEFLLKNEIQLNETTGAAFQDIGFVLQTIELAKRAMYVDVFFYCYRQNRVGASSINPNCIRYTYQEFKYLNDILLLSKGIAMREVHSFLSESKKVINTIENHIEEYDWLCNDIKLKIHDGLLTKEDFDKKTWEDVNKAIFHTDQYISSCENENDRIEKNKRCILNNLKNKNVVIFGCGILGLEAVEELIRNKISIIALIDNNPEKWNKRIAGITVCSPQNIVQKNRNARYLISNKKNTEEIKMQLIQMGVNERNILFFWR